jgi:Arc/MetJ family transcription regulator
MKTTIDIPDNSLREAIKHTGAKTKRDAVVTALDEFNRLRRLKRLATRWHGACPNFMSQEDLQNMRRPRAWEAAR